jgi:AAA domain
MKRSDGLVGTGARVPVPARLAERQAERSKDQMLIDADQLDTSLPEWLVENMIPRVGVGFWYGQRWTGKSLAVDVELALAIANGTPFFGREVVQGKVIVGLGEGLLDAGIRKQVRLERERQDRAEHAAQIAVSEGSEAAKAWIDAQPSYTDANLKYLTKPFALATVRDDGEAEISKSLRAFITRAKKIKDLELVILDSLSDFTGTISISNDTSANRVIQGLKMLASELNCFVLCVAHPTEKGDKMLGAGRLGNAADFIAKSTPEGKSGAGLDMSTVTCEKNKYGGRFEPFSYEVVPYKWYEPILDENDDPTGEAKLATSATIRQLDMDDAPSEEAKVIELDEDYEPFKPVDIDDGRPRKRSGLLGRGGRGQLSERSQLITEFVNLRPEGTMVKDVIDEFGNMGVDAAKAKVYLARAAARGDIARIETGLYGPISVPLTVGGK